MKILIFSLLTGILICMISRPGFATEKVHTAVQRQCWQHTLLSDKKYENQPVYLEVVFTGKGGESFRVPAFSDDGKTFHFRAAFPSSGIWKWQTSCSDVQNRALHEKQGQVKVKAYRGKNPLYRHGDLHVSQDKRYLIHSDGTPFLWLGDTGWKFALKSTAEEWQFYIDTRARQGFSVIQITPTGFNKQYPTSATGATSFTEEGKPDPVFWQNLEDKITYANKKGFMVLMVGIGGKLNKLFAQSNKDLAAYLAARFAGLMVIFSPSFDERYDEKNVEMAEELKKLTLHLVTQHPGTHYPSNLNYRNDLSTDFCGMQSGHHNGNLPEVYKAARLWTLDMWKGDPVKPVINIEAMYDGYGNLEGPNWRGEDSRKLGWISWLSGSMGYTYGAGDIPPKVPEGKGGIWNFSDDPQSNDYWRRAIFWPSAGEMSNLQRFMHSIPWWRLEPAHELILKQAEKETSKMVVSRSREGDFLLAYLPDNSHLKLDLGDFSKTMKGKWFNPVTGKYSFLKQPITPGAGVIFTKPSEWKDAVLLLTTTPRNEYNTDKNPF